MKSKYLFRVGYRDQADGAGTKQIIFFYLFLLKQTIDSDSEIKFSLNHFFKDDYTK